MSRTSRADLVVRFDHRGRELRRRLRVGAGKSSAIVLAMSTRPYCAIHMIDVETFVVGTDLRTSAREVGMADTRPVCA